MVGCGACAAQGFPPRPPSMNDLPSLFAAPPSVYAVGREYRVCVPTTAECTMWVECAGRAHYDHANGILRSGRPVHLASLPQRDLDGARAYAVCLRPIAKREAYYTKTGPVQRLEIRGFRPVAPRGATLRLLNVADTHSFVDGPVGAAAGAAPRPDLLLLNGDIPEDCGSAGRMAVPMLISGRVTGGLYPCVFARGNHDLRGVYAEQYAELTPTDAGRSYYEFRAGPVWGLALDTGEDKVDSCDEYGHTVCCEAFREEEEAWLRGIVRRGAPREAKWRVLVCHNPFSHRIRPPFDIEGPRWRRWCRMLGRLRPHALITGHLHECWLEPPGGAHDDYGAPCPVVCSSLVDPGRWTYTCGEVALRTDGAVSVRFLDETGRPAGSARLPASAPRTAAGARREP